MRRILLGLCFLSFLNSASGQEIPLPEKMPQTHPRVLTTPAGKQILNVVLKDAVIELDDLASNELQAENA